MGRNTNMKKNLLLMTLLSMTVAMISCKQRVSCTGVVVNKEYKARRHRDWHYIYMIDSVGAHCIIVDETTYHKYDLGEVATVHGQIAY